MLNPSPPEEISSETSLAVAPLHSSALLHLIYQSALDLKQWPELRAALLTHFREDRLGTNSVTRDSAGARSIQSHLLRALRIGTANSALQRERARLHQVLDTVTPPMVMFNQARQIQGMNAAGRAFFAESDEQPRLFSIQQNTLCCTDPELLTDLLARADREQCATLTATASAALRLCLYKNLPAADSYTLLLFDHDAATQHALHTLSSRAALSKKETEIVAALLHCSDLPKLAEHLHSNVQTTRQHLKNIFEKTGAHSQSELLAMVMQNIFLHAAAVSHSSEFLPQIEGMAHTRILRTADQRQISFAEFGDPQGAPVLYFHAINSSRLELLPQAQTIARHGIRLISVDRVGFGHTTYQERETHSAYVSDSAAVLDFLGLGKVGVLSCSAGSPHALAFAACLPERVTRVQCVSTVPTPHYVLASTSKSAMNGALNNFFRIAPRLLRPALELTLLGLTAETLMREVGTGSRKDIFTYNPLDVDYIRHPDHFPYFVASLIESLRQGSKAWANENVLINRPWDIRFKDISAPVTFWHGRRDTLVPLDMVEPFAEEIPHARIKVLEDETHLMIFRHLAQILPEFH